MIKKTVIIIVFLFNVCAANASVNSLGYKYIDSQSGIIEVNGVLTQSACRLDLSSSHQEIDLGMLGTGSFQKIGQFGTPVPLNISIKDCLISQTFKFDDFTKTTMIDRYQPSVSFSFLSSVTSENHNFVAVTGSTGIGLAIKDPYDKIIRIGGKGEALLLQQNQDILKFTITPVRIDETLSTGKFHAIIFFYLKYD